MVPLDNDSLKIAFKEGNKLAKILGISQDYFNVKKVDRDMTYSILSPALTVCDVGGASGIDGLPISKHVNFTVILDINLDALKLGKMRAYELGLRSKIDFIKASAIKLPFRGKALNLVTCFSVLDHLPNKKSAQTAIFEFARVILYRGHVVITLPNTLFLLGTVIMKVKYLTESDAFFEQRFTPKELLTMATLAGLTPINFGSSYPSIIGDCILKNNLPKIVNKLPTELLNVLLRLSERIFELAERISYLKLVAPRVGYLFQKSNHSDFSQRSSSE